MKKYILTLIFLVISLSAKEQKLELGVGVVSIIFPDYIGSKSIQSYTLPYPYIDYRGDYINIDNDGIKTKIFNIKDLELSISLNGSLPANSKDNQTRAYMPDLDFTFEIGPKIIYFIYANGKDKLYFTLPIRAIYATDFSSINANGFISNPRFEYEINHNKLYIKLSSGLMFADKEYNTHFYEVSPEYETPDRPAYKAAKGYNGLRNKIEIGYKRYNWWAGVALSHYNLRGAIFKDSPLVETNSATYFGVSVAYIFYSSLK